MVSAYRYHISVQHRGSVQRTKLRKGGPSRIERGFDMPDRRQNEIAEIALEHAVFLMRTRGINQAFQYLDRHNLNRELLWRIISNPIYHRTGGERREEPR